MHPSVVSSANQSRSFCTLQSVFVRIGGRPHRLLCACVEWHALHPSFSRTMVCPLRPLGCCFNILRIASAGLYGVSNVLVPCSGFLPPAQCGGLCVGFPFRCNFASLSLAIHQVHRLTLVYPCRFRFLLILCAEASVAVWPAVAWCLFPCGLTRA